MIDPQQYADAKDLFTRALDLDPAEREAFVRREARSEAVAERVLRLLARDAGAHALDEPLLIAALVLEEEGALPEIDGLRILRRLGEGGMGVVYEAEEVSSRRSVAVKLLRPGTATARLIRRLRSEIQILERLDHPGIARILGAGNADGAPYLVLELIEGDSLLAHAEEHGLDERGRAELVMAIAEALHHAHEQGVVHRDLKPSNILVTLDGRPKVLDFGVARLVDPDGEAVTTLTQAGQLVGTLPYMSPEQVALQPAGIQSDLYSLGVVAYELLTGRLPYPTEACSLAELARSIREQEAIPAGTVAARLRGDLTTILGKLLEKDPRRRYVTARALAEDLRAFLEGQPIRARPPSRLQRAKRFTRRHRGLVLGISAIFLVLAAGLAGTWTFAVRASERADEADAVRDLLVETLGWADPAQAQGRERTVREALDDASKKLASRTDLPERVLAELHGSLSDTYRSLGADEDALQHAEEAERLLVRLRGHDDGQAREARHRLGVILGNVGDLERSEALLREVADAGGAERGVVLSDLADTVRRLGRLDESSQLAQQAVDELRSRGDSPELLRALRQLSSELMYLGNDYERELQYAREAMELAERLGVEGESYLKTKMQLANALDDMARSDESIPLYQECLETRRSWYGDRHPGTIITAMNLGVALVRADRPEEAVEVLEETYRISREVQGAANEDTMLTAQNLADLYETLERYDQGIEFLEKALPDAPDNLRGWILHLQYGFLLSAAGRHAEAVDVLTEYFDRTAQALPPGHEALRLSAENLARNFEALGNDEEAAAWSRREEELRKLQENPGPG